MKMRALTFNPETNRWTVREIPVPSLAESDVLVRVHACGLNPVDAKIAQWKSMAPQMDENWVAGLDVSGEVAAVGHSVTQWKVGDRVLTHGNMLRPHGGFAEYCVQDARTLIQHPAISAELAAATPCAGWTAWRALHDKLRITPQDTLLIAGGAGGVGGFAIQIAKFEGLQCIIATCSAQNARYVKSLGAAHTIDYTSSDVTAMVREITNGVGVTRGLDCVGGANAKLVAESLGYEGEMVELVTVVEPKQYSNAFANGLSFHQLSLGSGHGNGDAGRARLTETGKVFSEKLERGEIRVPQIRTITLEEAAPELDDILQQRTVGKIVMCI